MVLAHSLKPVAMPHSRSQSESPSEDTFVRSPELVVLTGDLVSSARLSPEEVSEAIRALEAAAQEAATRGTGPARFTRFRGDGWQCLGPSPKFSLRTALLLRARLSALGRAYDTRISIGIGAGALDRSDALDGAAGPALEISGRGLDRLPHGQRFAIGWESPPPGAALIRAIFALADEISRNWTPAQARVLGAALSPLQRPNQEALARDLDIAQQAVAKHLASGGDWALREALDALEGAA